MASFLGNIIRASGTQKLPRLIGTSKAKKMILFAEKLKAEEALKINLIDYLAENWEDLDVVLNERLQQLSKNGPIAVRAAKKAIENGYSVDIETGLTIENSCYGTVLHSSDRIEGLKAFIEKRKPVYKNK